MNFRYVGYLFCVIFALAQLAWAMPPVTTYQAKIVKPDGYPLEAPNVNFKFSFLDPSGSCILYSESYFSVNMAGTGGLISFPLGSGTKAYPTSGTMKLVDVFNNRSTGFTCATGGPASYTPLANDIRKIIMQFHDGTSWQTLPAMAINSVPYAMYAGSADDSATLNGKADTDFVEKVNLPSCTGGDVLTFNGVSFSCVAAGSSVTSSTVVAALGYTPANGASYSALASSLITAQNDLTAVSSSVYSVSSTVSSLNSSVTSSMTALASSLNGKITSSTASLVQVLGYTPANSATVATLQSDLAAVSASANAALLKTNNLSDLANVATARSNLGLGAFATANSVDLGSASATGIIADARLANQSNVTSGTQYSKVTVDGKGRVTSGAQLSATDVTTALGYTPQASGVISSQWNTSGTTINYMSGDVGIGTTAPQAALEISGSATKKLILRDDQNGVSQSSIISFEGASDGAHGWVGFASTADDDLSILAQGASGDVVLGAGNSFSKGLRIKAATGNIGVGISAPVTRLDVNGGVRISMEAATCAVSYAGTLRYNAGSVEFCNGTTWAAFGVSGAGLQSLNGSTSGTQTFANGTTGNSPAFVTVNGVHTLNIPLASAGSVTAGLISNADYLNFKNKITSSTASVAEVLGYTPANSATVATLQSDLLAVSASANSALLKANNLSDLSNVATARTNLGLGTFATANSVDLGSTSATGTIADARLANQSNVSSGTQYTKVTVDGKGRVISGAQLTSSDVTTALGFTPGAAASGVTLLNGSASQTQTFANGTAGTTPAFVTANGVHTLNIPLASAASVTGGLLSNSDYTNFINYAASIATLTSNLSVVSSTKITSSAASIVQVLGYTPASATQLGNYLAIANNLSDVANSATTRTNLGVGYIGTLSSVDLGSADVSGTLAIARTPSYIGDVTKAAASNTLILSNSGVTSGTYTKVTVDAKGRVTSSSALTNSDVVTALGYTPGAATSGVTSLNGSASQTQTFANGTAGTTPAFVTANGVHTLNIPLASAASVTGGLLSNADYTTFVNYASSLSIVSSTKITSSAASIAAVLGYTPASATQLGNYLAKASNLSDLSNSATARTNLGVGYIGTLTSVDLGSADVSGTLAIARTPAYTGDVTKAAASNTLILSNTGVSAATYAKVTVDSKGRVTSGAQLALSDVTAALGYTPANSASATQWKTSGQNIYFDSTNVVSAGESISSTTFAAVGQSGTQLTAPTAGSIDDGYYTINLPFTVVYNNNSYSTLYIGTNSYVTFGSGSTAYSGLSATTPALDKILVGGADRGSNSVWYYGDANSFSIRYEGGCGTGAGTNRIWELQGTSANPNVLTLQIVADSCGGGVFGAYSSSAQLATIPATVAQAYTLTSTAASSLGYVGVGVSAPVTKLDVAGGIKISMEAASCSVSYAGTIRYYAGNIQFCNGTSWSAFGVTSSNLSDITSASAARTNLGLGTLATASSVDLGTTFATGTLAAARLPAFAGDVSSTAGSSSLSVTGLRGISISATAPVSGQVLAYNGSSWVATSATLSGGSSQWTTSGTAISYSTGNVGVGTSSPATALDVNGAATFRQAYFEKVGALGTLGCGSTNITGYSTNMYTATACSAGTSTLNIPAVTGWPSGSMSWTVTFFVTGQTSSVFNVSYSGSTASVYWDKNSTGGAGGSNYSGFLMNNSTTNVFTCTVLNTGSVNVYCGVSAQY